MPEGEEEEEEIENIFKKNNEGELPQSGKGNRLPGRPGSSESPKKLDPRKHIPRHIIITLPKIKHKERILKAERETLQARRGWKEVFKVTKSNDLHPRLLYSAKLSFRMEGQIKCFPR